MKGVSTAVLMVDKMASMMVVTMVLMLVVLRVVMKVDRMGFQVVGMMVALMVD